MLGVVLGRKLKASKTLVRRVTVKEDLIFLCHVYLFCCRSGIATGCEYFILAAICVLRVFPYREIQICHFPQNKTLVKATTSVLLSKTKMVSTVLHNSVLYFSVVFWMII